MNVRNLFRATKDKFEKAGLDSPAFDALCLVEKVCGITQAEMIANKDLQASIEQVRELRKLCKRRIYGEPLQYILGIWEFSGYKFKVGEGVLIPRDDTEVLLSVCLDYLENKNNAKVLDLCSGSGALAVSIAKVTSSNVASLLKLTKADVTAIEKSEKAFDYLNQNIKLNDADVNAIQGDIFECMDMFENNSFDLILSNPPYIKTDEIKTLQKEISFEPEMALDGGADGYDFYKHIVKHWSCKLKQGGMLAFELGEGQFDTVKELMEKENFIDIGEKLDLGNIQRVIYGTLNII